MRDSSSCSVVFSLSRQPYLERLLMETGVGTTRRWPTCEEALVIILMVMIMIKMTDDEESGIDDKAKQS